MQKTDYKTKLLEILVQIRNGIYFKVRNFGIISQYIDSDIFLADSVDLADISDFFADILTFFHDGW